MFLQPFLSQRLSCLLSMFFFSALIFGAVSTQTCREGEGGYSQERELTDDLAEDFLGYWTSIAFDSTQTAPQNHRLAATWMASGCETMMMRLVDQDLPCGHHITFAPSYIKARHRTNAGSVWLEVDGTVSHGLRHQEIDMRILVSRGDDGLRISSIFVPEDVLDKIGDL